MSLTGPLQWYKGRRCATAPNEESSLTSRMFMTLLHSLAIGINGTSRSVSKWNWTALDEKCCQCLCNNGRHQKLTLLRGLGRVANDEFPRSSTQHSNLMLQPSYPRPVIVGHRDKWPQLRDLLHHFPNRSSAVGWPWTFSH